VLSNLLANAHRHTPPGVTVTTAIRVVSGDAGRQVQLTVVDDGPGIDAKLIPDLFDRFVRGNRSQSDESHSTGLGLAIVASITEAHGGTVTARSGGGTTEFRIQLPAVD
jgi:two-component system sensor histidine kinase TrcS